MVRWCRGYRRVCGPIAPVVCLAALASAAVVAAAAGQSKPNLQTERAVAATVSETRMVDTVRRLVGFGPRMYGTPSNHQAAAWLIGAFREAGLEVTLREDTPRAWYEPIAWEVKATTQMTPNEMSLLKTTWPSSGSPPAKGEGPLVIGAAPEAVCLLSANPTPETTSGCAAALFDGRASASGWPNVGRLRGSWTIPVFVLSPREATPLRERLGRGEKVRVAFSMESKTGSDAAHTVVATLPGRDRSKYVLFCAHGDSDSGGPGANDNASGVSIVLEIARAAAAAVRSGALPRPAYDLRFAAWGGEMSSSRQYVESMAKDSSRLLAVFNFDQSGFGSSNDALYVEPDDVPVNRDIIALVRSVMADHLGTRGFPARAASVKSQGGTDSYVFQNTRSDGATFYPAVTLFTSAWDRERPQPITEGFPPLNWRADEKTGMVTVDGDAFYHSVGDTPENTTDKEPFNMAWCARVALLSALRLLSSQ